MNKTNKKTKKKRNTKTFIQNSKNQVILAHFIAESVFTNSQLYVYFDRSQGPDSSPTGLSKVGRIPGKV